MFDRLRAVLIPRVFIFRLKCAVLQPKFDSETRNNLNLILRSHTTRGGISTDSFVSQHDAA